MDKEASVPLVTLARFTFLGQAESARIALDSEGIDSILFDESQAANIGGGVLIPIRLQVYEDDVEAAKAVLTREGLYKFQ